jgi:hypothetical protein
MEKTKEIIDYLKFSTKLRVLRYAKDCGKNKDACEVFEMKRVVPNLLFETHSYHTNINPPDS